MTHIAQPFEQSVTPAFIRVRNVTKHFHGKRVLDDVNLDISKGEVRCIIGPSGSGKSTLLRCLNGLNDIDGGAVIVGETRVGYTEHGKHLKSWTGREAAAFRSRIGLVSQQVNLFSHRTVLENVIEGPVHVLGTTRKEAIRNAIKLLARVGLSEKHGSYPGQLSGGQQQRAAIARALAMDPAVMLFDEATSALDPKLVGEVLNVMQSLASDGMTMIVVTHEMRFAREVGDRIAVMENGRIIEDATASELFSTPRHPRTAEFLKDHFAPSSEKST
ncbi:amino acid ABC transporter ATP-binding protein [Agrobacterium burrii]